MARGVDSQSGHLGLPFGVGRHLDPIVVQADDQAHDRVADPQGPGSFPDEGSGSTKGVLPLLRVSRHSRAEDMTGLFEVAPLTEELTTWSGTSDATQKPSLSTLSETPFMPALAAAVSCVLPSIRFCLSSLTCRSVINWYGGAN